MNKTFIYGLIDPRDNIIKYIGKSINIKTRLYYHIYNAKNSKKRKSRKEIWINKLLKLSYTPTLIILHECNVENFSYWEEFYIKKYKSKFLTNYDDKGIGKISNPINLGKLSKPILKFNLNGKFIKEYKSLREAEKLTSINHGNISKVCRKKSKHAAGFIFRYKSDSSKIEKVFKPNGLKKSVLKLDLNNNIIEEYESISLAAKKNKIDTSQISRICNNKIKSKKINFKFKKI